MSLIITPGYSDSNVDTHLNTSTATSGKVLGWSGTDYAWVVASALAASGGITEIAIVTTLPTTPNLTTLYIVTE